MITVLVEEYHARVSYTLELVFRTLLNTNWRSLEVDKYVEGEVEGAVLNYTRKEIPGVPRIPCSGFLYESGIRKEFVPEALRPGSAGDFDLPVLFPQKEKGNDALVPLDIFAAIFYLASEYSHYSHEFRDQHDRHDEWALYPLFNLWINEEPLCHQYAEELWSRILAQFPSLTRLQRKFDYEVTIDIDNPWKYRNKGLAINIGGLGKDLLGRRFWQVAERLGAISRPGDPYDTYDEIRDLCPKEKTRFFFLINRHTPFDSRFSYKNNAYRKLITKLTRDWGYPGGLHPSYATYNDFEKMEFEAKALKVLIPNFDSSRQHYLRYRLPETFRNLEKLGIRNEYSVCPVKYVGFKTGLCIPYKWYDLGEERKSNLTLHPAVVMDRSLQQYLKLDPLFARKEIQGIVEKVKRANGKFVVILHNETFSESGEWKGWKPVLVNMLELLKKEAYNEG